MMSMKAVILAGGKGARLQPYTKILPKPLMPIGDMPILEILLRQLKRAGIEDIVLTVGHLAGILQAFFRDGSRWGVKIEYSLEDQPLGTAGPLSLLSDLNQTFLVANGDVLTTLDFNELVDAHKRSKAVATIAIHSRQEVIDLGVVEVNAAHQVVGYLEKPRFDYQVSMGIYVFEPEVLKFIPYGEYLDFPDLILRLLGEGCNVMAYPFEGYWQDLGRKDDYEQAISEFEVMRKQILGEDEL